MKVGIHQPNYIPWCGYFAKISYCDVFIFLDDAEISPGQSYVYRSMLRNEKQSFWLSEPSCRHKNQRIMDVEFANSSWSKIHLDRIHQAYRKAPYFQEIMELLTPCYSYAGNFLAPFNINVIRTICRYLEIYTPFERSSDLEPTGISDERLISLVLKTKGDIYVSGKGGQNYQDPEKFRTAGIDLEIKVYSPLPYKQIHGDDFIAGLSVIDCLLNYGKEAISFLSYSNSK